MVKTAMISTRSNKTNDELEAEIEAMMAEASRAPQQPQEEPEEVEPTTPTRESPKLPERRSEASTETREEEGEPEGEPLSGEEKTYKKRYGDLRRHSQKQLNDLKVEIDQLKEQLKQKPSTNLPPTDPEKIQQWAETNPQAAAIIRALAGEQAETKSKEFATRLEEIEELSRNVAREKEEAKIYKVHPDFDDIRDDDAFHDWAEGQPEVIQNMVYDGVAKDVIYAVSLYKKENNIKTSKEEKEAARTTSRRSNRTEVSDTSNNKRWSESKVDRMSAAEYQKNEDAIMAAMRDGSFVYDITGGVR